MDKLDMFQSSFGKMDELCHPSNNRGEAHYKIYYRINKIKSEWKGALKYMQNMVKGFHNFFKAVVNDILQDLPTLGESGSKVSYLIPKPRKFPKVTILP